MFNTGMQPNSFQEIIVELHHKEHHCLALIHEYSYEGNASLSNNEM